MADKKEYVPSQKVKEAEAAVEAQKNNRPEAYRSGWDAQMKEAMDRILNREDFHYNLDGDALYRQYRDHAMTDGRRAMQDTMGQAAAMTGGYGNSYAENAGQQAYWRQMEGLADRIPELYALAMDQYRQQTDNLRQKYDLLAGAEGMDYARYQDALSAWQKEAEQLRRDYADARDYDYRTHRDDVSDWQWQQSYDESKRRYDQEWEAAHPQTPQVVYYSGSPKKKPEKQEEPPKLPLGLAVGALSGIKKLGV